MESEPGNKDTLGSWYKRCVNATVTFVVIVFTFFCSCVVLNYLSCRAQNYDMIGRYRRSDVRYDLTTLDGNIQHIQ